MSLSRTDLGAPFVHQSDPWVHIAKDLVANKPEGGIAMRSVCGWMGFVNPSQIREENPTCPKCSEAFKGPAVVVP